MTTPSMNAAAKVAAIAKLGELAQDLDVVPGVPGLEPARAIIRIMLDWLDTVPVQPDPPAPGEAENALIDVAPYACTADVNPPCGECFACQQLATVRRALHGPPLGRLRAALAEALRERDEASAALAQRQPQPSTKTVRAAWKHLRYLVAEANGDPCQHSAEVAAALPPEPKEEKP